MTENAKEFEWSFERSQFDTSNDQNATFSVGIFQWLPTASGKGLKKSKTIRVMGYVSDPETVYQKATELCFRLNNEQIRFDDKPSWLQRQYSVPLPAGQDKKQNHKNELLEAFKTGFKEHGFKKFGATWIREESEVFCVFNVQTSQWSESYYFNAGIYVKDIAPIERPSEAHCHWRTRLPDKIDDARVCNALADFENLQGSAGQKIEELYGIVFPSAIEWFSRYNTIEKLRHHLSSSKQVYPLPSLALLRFLGISLPERKG